MGSVVQVFLGVGRLGRKSMGLANIVILFDSATHGMFIPFLGVRGAGLPLDLRGI